jgi:hypothetical protein
MAPALRMTHVTKASYKFFLQKFSVRLRSKPLLLPRIHQSSQCNESELKARFVINLFSPALVRHIIDICTLLHSCA